MDSELKKKTAAAQRGFRPSVIRASVPSVFSGEFPPTVVLEPLNSTSGSTKHLELFEKVKVGRQVSPKTEPSPTNGYFNSKVLSRNHAEIWYENNAVYVKDLKSSNGTYLNSVRLSEEGLESSPYKLNGGDILEFGIDILNAAGEALYHRVACKVQIKFPTSHAGTTLESSSSEQSTRSADVKPTNKNKSSEELAKIYNPIPQVFGIASEGIRSSNATSTQNSPVVSPTNLNASTAAVIPKAILERLQDEAQLASQESDELDGILNTITELMATHQMQIDRLRDEEAKKIEKLTYELTQKDALYQRLEKVTSKREAQLIDESKLLLQQLHSQRQSNQKLLTENSNLFVALVQHCPEFSERNLPEKVIGHCECSKGKTSFFDSAIKRYEHELVKSLSNNFEIKEENERLRSCLERLASNVEKLSLSVNTADAQSTSEGPADL